MMSTTIGKVFIKRIHLGLSNEFLCRVKERIYVFEIDKEGISGIDLEEKR